MRNDRKKQIALIISSFSLVLNLVTTNPLALVVVTVVLGVVTYRGEPVAAVGRAAVDAIDPEIDQIDP